MAGTDTVLASFDSKSGLVEPTPLFTSLGKMIEEFKPDLTIVGNRVNIFAVNQNDDSQARQCMMLLTKICMEYGTTVIMPGHVSVGSAQRGEGTSGSVQWSNACRHRTYLRRVYEDDGKTELDPNQRELEVMKTNHAATGKVITFGWNDGLYKCDDMQIEKQKEEQSSAEVFAGDLDEVLRLFDSLLPGEHVSPNVNAPKNYIVTTFLKKSRRFRGHRDRLEAALRKLHQTGTIANVEDGPPSKKRERVIRVQK
jgi:RecA-family ATPase